MTFCGSTKSLAKELSHKVTRGSLGLKCNAIHLDEVHGSSREKCRFIKAIIM